MLTLSFPPSSFIVSSSSLLALTREGRNDFTCDRAEEGSKKERNKKKDSEEMEGGGSAHIII